MTSRQSPEDEAAAETPRLGAASITPPLGRCGRQGDRPRDRNASHRCSVARLPGLLPGPRGRGCVRWPLQRQADRRRPFQRQQCCAWTRGGDAGNADAVVAVEPRVAPALGPGASPALPGPARHTGESPRHLRRPPRRTSPGATRESPGGGLAAGGGAAPASRAPGLCPADAPGAPFSAGGAGGAHVLPVLPHSKILMSKNVMMRPWAHGCRARRNATINVTVR